MFLKISGADFSGAGAPDTLINLDSVERVVVKDKDGSAAVEFTSGAAIRLKAAAVSRLQSAIQIHRTPETSSNTSRK